MFFLYAHLGTQFACKAIYIYIKFNRQEASVKALCTAVSKSQNSVVVRF